MDLLRNAFKSLDDIGQEVGRHAGYAIEDISRVAEGIGQQVVQHVDPSTLKAIENFGKIAGNQVGSTADDICKALLDTRTDLGKKVQPLFRNFDTAIGGAGNEVKNFFSSALVDENALRWSDLPAHIRDWIENNPQLTAGIILSIVLPIVTGPLAASAATPILNAFGFTAEGIAAGVS